MANERWASDANYPAGSDPWSAQPTKVAPDAGEIAAGHTPGTKRPAEVENWWKNRTDARIEGLEGSADIFPMKPYLTQDAGPVTTFSVFGGAEFSAGSASITFMYPLRVGRTIVGFKLQVQGDAAADLAFGFSTIRGTDSVAFTVDPDHVDDVPGAVWTTVSIAIEETILNGGSPVAATNYTVQHGDLLAFTPQPSAANINILSVTVLYA